MWGVRTLGQLHQWLTGSTLRRRRRNPLRTSPMWWARFAVEVAAAGAHHLMMTGPPCRQNVTGPTSSGAAAAVVGSQIPGGDGDLPGLIYREVVGGRVCFCCIRVPSLRRRRSGRLHTADRLSGSITPKRVEPVDRLGGASEHGGHGVSVRQQAAVWFTGGTPGVSASVPRARDPHSRRPIERRAVRVEWRPVHRLVARAAGPRGVPAAVPEAGLMADEDLAGAEAVPVRASRRRVGDPLPGRGLYQLAQHDEKPSADWPVA